jgi:endonuclease/exonuclease/phosphatase family metal-dependent hydrolase
MRIMTFNIRFENDHDGANSWSYRRELCVEVIRKYSPAILGTQEGTLNQLNYLRENLPGYAIHAPQRVLDDSCQYPTLFFRRDLLDVRQGGEFWLSTTPRVHRSKDWDSAFPRMMSYALFACRLTGVELWVVVTHLDNLGAQARVEQAGIIMNWLRERPGPVIVMGDFNDVPGSALYRLVTAADYGLQDTWETGKRPDSEPSMTHHDFHGNPKTGRLDWILVSRHFRVREAGIIRDEQDARYPSDHFPYCVELEWV